ncbi:hypothetical protein [Marinobacter sp.]|uniref:hypothetical protein n=1 Tax=Marinobacter sp. TaxID=50741 RepID=UPI00384F19FE
MQDLEIYIRDLEPGQLSNWLEVHLDNLTLVEPEAAGRAMKGEGQYRGQPVVITVYQGAFGKRYASLTLEGDELPWSSDLECARSAWRSLETEIRCSPGDWQEGEPVEEEKWWRLDERGEHLVIWN